VPNPFKTPIFSTIALGKEDGMRADTWQFNEWLEKEYMNGAEIDTLNKLGRAYPHGVEAGNIPSKVGLNGLISRGWAQYQNGTSYLTAAGWDVYASRKRLTGAI
jgi:hypothetical protein